MSLPFEVRNAEPGIGEEEEPLADNYICEATTPAERAAAVGANTIDDTFDFGSVCQPPGSIGDRIWLDDNGNGVQDPGEPGLNGVTVELRDENNQLITTTVTEGDGNYLFPNLPSSTYTIVVDPAGLPEGATYTFDSDDAPDGTTSVVLEPGQNLDTLDFGLQPPPGTVQLGDFVWLDENANGVQDEGEPGVPNLEVNLWVDDDRNGEPDRKLRTMETTPSGGYRFVELDPMLTYMVEFIAPEGRSFTTVHVGNAELDSDAQENGLTGMIRVEPGAEMLSIDAGVLAVAVEPPTTPTALDETQEPVEFGRSVFLPLMQR